MNFNVLKIAVAHQFERMQGYPMFRVDISKDELWSTYLNSFPPGANEIYRKRAEHDCSCCKQFVRAVGDVVAIIDGEIVSVWDVSITDEPAYQKVAFALARLVESKPIAEPFLHYEPTAGTDKNFEQVLGESKQWNHFHVRIKPAFVASKASIPTKLGEARTAKETFGRACTTITDDAVQTVLDLIAQNSLYRGAEHLFAVTEFQKHKRWYDAHDNKEVFLWITRPPGSVGGIRNTAIGTLLVDLSEGRDLESAVKSFETKVGATNYKRPTALVTKAMIEKAKKTVTELGLASALERRYAVLEDISIKDVLFADRTSRAALTGDVFDELSANVSGTTTGRHMDKVEEVPIDKFIGEIVPRASSIEVLFENGHVGNLVSLIAPADPQSGDLFKWPNKFSWSYNGEVADSIKERVKQAGGNVTGDLCCRLAWFNHDDLDFHMVEPSGREIYFGNKRSQSGQLDVDMNAGYGVTRTPVENIFYGDRRKMLEGEYELSVVQFNRRETVDGGFEVEIDYMGTVHRFAHSAAVPNRSQVRVARFRYTHAKGFELIESLPSTGATRMVWGLQTQSLHKVNVLTMSPNYWGDHSVGNRHYFFMLDGCANDGLARGFYNEFLNSELDAHRKVFEMLGAKLKPEPSERQLSGLGFSSTQKNTLICRVKGSFTRTIKVVF